MKKFAIAAKQIPGTNRNGWTDAVELTDGYSVRVHVDYDQCADAPWEMDDGHGPVSDWRQRDSKIPGERILVEDHGKCRFYDFAEAVKIARRDRWGFKGQYVGNSFKAGMTEEAKAMTPDERAARAVEEDFHFLADWCNGRWCYLDVGVEVSRCGAVLDTDYCGGVEGYNDYWRENAADHASWVIQDDQRKRKAAAAAARKETLERRYWSARDVLTTSEVV